MIISGETKYYGQPPVAVSHGSLIYIIGLEQLSHILEEVKPLAIAQWAEIEQEHRPDTVFDPDYDKLIGMEQISAFACITIRRAELIDDTSLKTESLAGYFMVSLVSDLLSKRSARAHEVALYVHPEDRSLPVTMGLFRYVEDLVKKVGVSELTVTSRPNAGLAALLKRRKFELSYTVHSKMFGGT